MKRWLAAAAMCLALVGAGRAVGGEAPAADAEQKLVFQIGNGEAITVTPSLSFRIQKIDGRMPLNVLVTPGGGSDWRLFVSAGPNDRYLSGVTPEVAEQGLLETLQSVFEKSLKSAAVEKEFAPQSMKEWGRLGFYHTVTDARWAGKDIVPDDEWRYMTSFLFCAGDSMVVATGLSDAKNRALIEGWLEFLTNNLVLTVSAEPAGADK